MKILGIDASGMVASVAIVEDDIVVGEYSTNFKKTHSQTLLPMLEELKKMIGCSRTGLFYRTPYRFGDGKGIGTCSGQADHIRLND